MASPLLAALARNLAGTLDPAAYVRNLGFDPFDWQQEALDPTLRRLVLLTARQSGKSTVVAGKTVYKAKYFPGSLILIICPAQDQSKELMKKVDTFMRLDPEIELVRDGAFEKELANGSRIVALPGSERSVRGYSGPAMILIDEAARVLDETYRAARPMMVGADTELVLMSTPFGKRGFFHDAWANGRDWTKIEVTVGFEVQGFDVVPASLSGGLYRWQQAARGISAYYSPRHDAAFLCSELDSLGEWWWRQEYRCEFLETAANVFSYDEIMRAVRDDVEPLLEGRGVTDEVLPLEV